MEAGEMGPQRPSGCMWGCVALLLLGISLLVFGFDIVGKACLVIGPASVLFHALKIGRFGWILDERELRREKNPGWFWFTAASFAALSALSLLAFVDEVRRSTS